MRAHKLSQAFAPFGKVQEVHTCLTLDLKS